MNRGTVTGGVVKAAASAYTQATAERASIRRVLFSIAVADSKGEGAFWNCEAEGGRLSNESNANSHKATSFGIRPTPR